MIFQHSVKIKRKIKEFCNFVIMPKNEVTKLSDMYKRIEALCKERGVNITEMCRGANIPRGNLTELKMGRTLALSTKTLSKISSYFNVSIEQLIGEEQKKPAEQVSGLRGTGYENLTPENQKMIDALIETLLKSQSDV